MQKPKVRIFHNLARSGETLVCRCLGSMSNIVLLSEIHPFGHNFFHIQNPLFQAHQWHDLIQPEDVRGKEYSFIEVIHLIENKCREKYKHLILRDWSHLDFIGIPFINNPPKKMLLVESLLNDFELIRLALVRHPIDQWISTNTFNPLRGILSIDIFLDAYLKYAVSISQIGFTRYEDFTRDPVKQMQWICEKIMLQFDEKFIDKWYTCKKISGDYKSPSRGDVLNRITSLPRLPIEANVLQQFQKNKKYWEVLNVLGYADV